VGAGAARRNSNVSAPYRLIEAAAIALWRGGLKCTHGLKDESRLLAEAIFGAGA
jgi:hypothetical protein